MRHHPATYTKNKCYYLRNVSLTHYDRKSCEQIASIVSSTRFPIIENRSKSRK